MGSHIRALSTAVAAVIALTISACGSSGGQRVTSTTGPASVPQPVALNGPAFGVTEDNASLLWSPTARGRVSGAFRAANRELGVLRPTYVRLLVDWAALQPRADRPPALQASVDGCARAVGPCRAYGGIREELAALASRQRTDAGNGGSAFQVVIDVFGVPAWAAAAPSGCEAPGTPPFARPLRPGATAGYRALIRSVLRLGASEGVALRWWSPWNEPNDPRFISPQRASCSAQAAPLSPGTYAELARAMDAELRAFGGDHELVLGELNDYPAGSPETTSVAQFVASLPAQVICLSRVWSIHAYARYGPGAGTADAVGELESALASKGPCGRTASVWVTEAGAGAPHPGLARTASVEEEQEGCRELARQLIGWHRDPRVGAVFQYSFREDPAFPVGLVSADLGHLYPSYGLWLAYLRARVAGEPAPTAATGCA